MQRWCSKLRSIAALHSAPKTNISLSSNYSHRLLHSYPNLLHKPLVHTAISPNFIPTLNAPSTSQVSAWGHSSFLPLSLMQVRYITAKQKKRKLKSRKPMTPIISKVKKIKMKAYSSYKGRFRVRNDGTIKRWKEGKRHNAHSKSRKAKRRLRQPGTVPLAYAKVMKKLSFCA